MLPGCLFCFILCFAMVLSELWIVSATGVRNAPVSVWPLTAALLLVTGWSGVWLGRERFPKWVGRGRGQGVGR